MFKCIHLYWEMKRSHTRLTCYFFVCFLIITHLAFFVCLLLQPVVFLSWFKSFLPLCRSRRYDSNPVPTKLATTQETAPQYEDRVLPRQNVLPPLPNPVYEEDRLRQEEEKRERKERKHRKKEKRHQEKERMEAESEKSESVEVVGNNVIPVEDDFPAPLA